MKVWQRSAPMLVAGLLVTLGVAAGGQTPGACNEALWKAVWQPRRLQVVDRCKTVTGTIMARHANEDGDEHMELKLDPGQEGLLTKANRAKQRGRLVIEAVCVNKVTQKSAKPACKDYVNQLQIPQVGDHVRVSGSYVNDRHNGWMEIHPISRLELIR